MSMGQFTTAITMKINPSKANQYPLAIFVSLLLASSCGLPPETEERAIILPRVTSVADPLRSVSATDHQGKVVMVYLWATWCAPCRKASPAVDDIYEKYREKGLEVMAINSGEPEPTVTSFLKKSPKVVPVYLDPKREVAAVMKAESLPMIMIINREGVPLQVVSGASTGLEAELESAVREAL